MDALLQGRGGEELSTELSVALQRCLLGGKSGTGMFISKNHFRPTVPFSEYD